MLSTWVSPRIVHSSSVSPSSWRRSLMALSLIWRGDSSPDTYKVRKPLLLRGICRARVDLPMPGSPPRSIMDPGTIPPPRIRSTSLFPMSILLSLSTEMSLRGTGLDSEIPTRAFGLAADEALVLRDKPSFMVFHSPHAGQRPIHLEVSLPHDVQYHTVLTLEGMPVYSENGIKLTVAVYSNCPSVSASISLRTSSLTAGRFSSLMRSCRS